MKKNYYFLIFSALSAAFILSSCARSGEQVWDDTKSCGRYVKKGFCSLGGKQGDSRQVRCREEFYCQNDYGMYGDNDFVPLNDLDYDDQIAMADFVPRPAKASPGDPGSAIPGIHAFKDPSTVGFLAGIFRNIQFPLDSSLIKGQDNLARVTAIADYMKKNPGVYIFVEGHCDERGAEAYNLSLGARRANSVRTALIKAGVSPDNIFTISYGKERPLVFGHNEDAWQQNRRSEFKVYQH